MIDIACRNPINAWQHNFFKTKKGRAYIVFTDKKRQEKDANIKNWSLIQIPCGQCMECRLKKAHDWSQRLMLELPKHNAAYFITLTYNEENMPHSIVNTELGSLRKKDMQDFLKRWRVGTKEYTPGRVKYFYCGEYGELTARPHYHIIMFQDNPIPDLYEWSKSNGLITWRSKIVEDKWSKNNKPIGNVLIGTVTQESCDYVARYITKKQLGLHTQIYETNGILPPYVQMSNGIGAKTEKEILEMYHTDIVNIPKQSGVKTMKPAAYYDEQLREIDEDYYNLIKEQRRRNRIISRDNELIKTGLSEEEMRENKTRKKDKKYRLLERSKI